MGRASGLGIASREYAQALIRQGVDVKVESAMKTASDYGKANKRRILIYHYPPNTIDLKRARKQFDSIILNTVWETTQIPKRWTANINRFDAVCVPSLQNKQALRRSGVKVPVFIVPHGVDTKKFTPGNSKLRLPIAKGKFVFISVFGFQHRKNPEALLRAYWEEFSAGDNVLLVIKTNGYARNETQAWINRKIQRYKERLGIRKKTAPVLLIARNLRPEQLKALYTLGNAFVLPSRGEGVGLPFLESLASGVPVITTGWGGHMDFLTNKNAFFIKYKLRPPALSMNGKHAIARPFRHLFAEKGQLWAEADIGSLRKQMRFAYKNPGLCRKKGMQGKKDMHKQTWTRAGISLKQAIEKTIRSKSSK